MTWLVVGLAALAATIIVGIRRARGVYLHQLEADDDGPPDWVTGSDRPLYQRFIEAVDWALWDEQMRQKQ